MRALGIVVRTLTWNLFHGRDNPPDAGLCTWRSRVFRVTETNSTHAQVNRSLREEFAAVLAGYGWDVAFLQEAPPRWLHALGRSAGAQAGASALTARNWGAPIRRRLAERNPDLIAVAEGGSNQVLVRPPWRIAECRRLTLTLRPERRRMLWARLVEPGGASLCVANMHLTSFDSEAAGREVLLAAERAVEWTGEDPLVLGGDLNMPGVFDRLDERFGLVPPAPPRTTDHLLGRGLEVLEHPHALAPEEREVPGPAGRAVRLSDHAPVVACFGATDREHG